MDHRNYSTVKDFEISSKKWSEKILHRLITENGLDIDAKAKKIYFYKDIDESHLLQFLNIHNWSIHPMQYSLCVNDPTEQPKGILQSITSLFTNTRNSESHPLSIWWNNFTRSFVPNIEIQECPECRRKECIEVKWRQDGSWYQVCNFTHDNKFTQYPMKDWKKEYEQHINRTIKHLDPNYIHVIEEEYEKERESLRLREKYLTKINPILTPEIKLNASYPAPVRYQIPEGYTRNTVAYDEEEELCRRMEEMRKGLKENFTESFKPNYLHYHQDVGLDYESIIN